MTYDPIINLSVWSDTFFRLGIMMMIGSAVAYFADILEKRDGRKRPRGVVIFCTLLILASIYKLWGFLNYGYYRFMFQQLTEQTIFARYCVSVTLRLAGLVIAVGVLFLKDNFRKLFLLLSLLTLCTLYWKHPFFVFENIAKYTEHLFLNKMDVRELTYPIYLWASIIFHYMVEIIFSGSALYYFTRTEIKERFN